jgi:hypothetical protein
MPIWGVTQEEFKDYNQIMHQIMNWLEQEPCKDCISRWAVHEYVQESETKQKQILLDELSTMSPTVISAAYLFATNYDLYGINIAEVWKTAKQNASMLEIAYRKGYHDALQKVAESEK